MWRLTVNSPFSKDSVFYEGPVEPIVTECPSENYPIYFIETGESKYLINANQVTVISIVKVDDA